MDDKDRRGLNIGKETYRLYKHLLQLTKVSYTLMQSKLNKLFFAVNGKF